MGKKKGSVASNEPSIEDLVELKRRTRKAHRAYLKQLVAETKALLEDHDTPQRLKAVQLKGSLDEQLDSTKKIDEEILNLFEKEKESRMTKLPKRLNLLGT